MPVFEPFIPVFMAIEKFLGKDHPPAPHGHGLPYKVPHWTKYKVGDHTPELQMLEKKLAALGLKDPWIRNEVWRFDRGFQPTMWGNAKMLFKRGAVVGISLGVISAGISIAWEKQLAKHHAAHAPHGEH